MQDCETDKVIRTITPVLISVNGDKQIYDLGENITGRIVFDTDTSETLVFEHGERMTGGMVDFSTAGQFDIQIDTFVGDGKMHKNIYPHFTWHGFRYFVVSGGNIYNPVCQVIHTDIKCTSDFKSDNDTLNKLYEYYIRTQLSNIHGSIPTDCPHRERLGYTGNGQLTSETVMLLFDARKMYKKWMTDICSCQSIYTGHIQHTAPFAGGGGGPCGWGGAVVVVPYNYYRAYKDITMLSEHWGNICRWFDYIETRCENGIVTHEEAKGWCLGDWNIPDHPGPVQTALSDSYVNTVLLVNYYGFAY